MTQTDVKSDFAARQISRSKIVLFTEANSPFGEEFVRRVYKHPQANLLAVVTRAEGVFSPDFENDAADVPAIAARYKVPLLRFQSADRMKPLLLELHPEYFIVANYQLRLPPPIVAIPSRFCINFHVGPLPRYAGLRPWHWMWRNHEAEGGVVAIRISNRIDAGDIIEQCVVPLSPNSSEEQIRERHFHAAYILLQGLLERLPKLCADDFRSQDLRYRTYYGRTGLVDRECGSLAMTTAPS